MVKIQFIKDFATKKKDDMMECDGVLASILIKKKVAKKRVRITKQK